MALASKVREDCSRMLSQSKNVVDLFDSANEKIKERADTLLIEHYGGDSLKKKPKRQAGRSKGRDSWLGVR